MATTAAWVLRWRPFHSFSRMGNCLGLEDRGGGAPAAKKAQPSLESQIGFAPRTVFGGDPLPYWEQAYRLRACFANGDTEAVHEGLVTLAALGSEGEVAFGYSVDKLTEWKGSLAIPVLDRYVVEKGSESFIPWLLRGWFLVKWAWEARSGRTIDHVSRSAYGEFRRRLALARTDLDTALTHSTHGEIFAAMLKVSVGEEWDGQASHALFERAIQGTSRLHWAVWTSMLTKLTEKWGGSHAEMFGLARHASKMAPEGHYLNALTALAHAERYLFFSMDDDEDPAVLKRQEAAYFTQQAVVEDVLNAYRAYCGPPGTTTGEHHDPSHQHFALVLWKIWDATGQSDDSIAEHARCELKQIMQPAEDFSPAWAWLTNKNRPAAFRLVSSSLGV